MLVGFGTEEQKSRWLAPIATGDVIASFAPTEPGAGSNPAGLHTKAVRDGTDWLITGQKRFITNAPVGRPDHRLRAHSTRRRIGGGLIKAARRQT